MAASPSTYMTVDACDMNCDGLIGLPTESESGCPPVFQDLIATKVVMLFVCGLTCDKSCS